MALSTSERSKPAHIDDWLNQALERFRQPPTPEQEAQWAAAEAERIEREQEQADRDRRSAFQASGVPKRFVATVLGGLDDTDAVKRVRAWGQDEGSWCLVLGGSFGVGKSIAAASWVLSRCTRIGVYGAPRVWWTAPELARVGNYDQETYTSLAEGYTLVIDDLGTEYRDANGSFVSFLGDLVSARHDNERKTIITTNLNAADLKSRYGERIIERLIEGGTLVGVGGPNLRRAP